MLNGTVSQKRDKMGLERVTRIELAYRAWEASVLPLNYTRICSALVFKKENAINYASTAGKYLATALS